MLPPELIDFIISFLQGDRPSLCQCALTCHAWRPASQYNLFHEVRIASRSRLELFRLRALLVPHMKTYLFSTQRLIIVDNADAPFAQIIPHHFVGHMTRLRSIEFWYINWSHGSPYYKTFSMTLSGFTSITELVLSACAFHSLHEFAGIVSALPRLADLHISGGIRWDHASSDGSDFKPSNLRRPCLRSFTSPILLDSKHFATICTWLLQTPSAHSITRLDLGSLFHIPRGNLPAIGKLLHSLGRSLLSLSIPLFDSTEISLVQNTSLLSLDVNILGPLFAGAQLGGSPWTKLASMISRVTSHLCQLYITYNTKYIDYAGGGVERKTGMTALDSILARDNFRDLQTLRLKLMVRGNIGVGHESLRDRVVRDAQQGLRHIHARGFLFVEVQVLPG